MRDRFRLEAVPEHEKAIYLREKSVVKTGDCVLDKRAVRGIVNLLSMDGNALNERILKLRNLEIDQIIKVTIAVIDDDIVFGEN